MRYNNETLIIRVWLDGFKKLPWLEAEFDYKDPWLNLSELVIENGGLYDASKDNLFEGVTPRKVSVVIQRALEENGPINDVIKTIKLKSSRDWFNA